MSKSQSTTQRLPCRGCTKNCKNYATCNGVPWRMEQQKTATHPQHSTVQ